MACLGYVVGVLRAGAEESTTTRTSIALSIKDTSRFSVTSVSTQQAYT